MKLDISRLRRSDRVIGIGAIALFIFVFLFKWYGYSGNAPSITGANVSSSYSINGWHTFTVNRWIWLITIIVALGAVAISAGVLKLKSPVQPGVLVAGLGALSTLTILYRIIHHPTANASFGSFHASVGIKLGIWLGLAAAAVLTYGGYLAMQDEGTTLSDVRSQASDALGGLSAAAGGENTSSATTSAPVASRETGSVTGSPIAATPTEAASAMPMPPASATPLPPASATPDPSAAPPTPPVTEPPDAMPA
jgi:hypothetical protein